MSAEYQPFSRAHALEQGFPLRPAHDGVRVDRRHQYGRVPVVPGLLRGHAVDVDVYVASKGHLVPVVDQDHLPLEMAAPALVDLEAQLPDVQEPDGIKRDLAVGTGLPQHLDLVRRDRLVRGQDLAYTYVRLVEGVALPEPVPALVLLAHAFRAPLAGEDLVEQRAEAYVVQVGVRHQHPLPHRVEIRQDLPHRLQGLLAVAGVAGVHEQGLPVRHDDGHVAPAGRLYHGYLRPVGYPVAGDPRVEGGALAGHQQLGELPDGVERVVRGETLAVQELHGHVAVHEELLPLALGDPHGPRYGRDEGAVEDRVVVDRAGAVVVEDVHLAHRGGLGQEPGHLLGALHEEPPLEPLVPAPVLLGAYVGDVEPVPLDELQDPCDASRLVLQDELHEHHGPLAARAVYVAYVHEPPVGLGERLRGAVDVYEQGVGVHRLVVADPGDVHPELREASAGLQERAYIVRHRCDIGLLHRSGIAESRYNPV